jgi:ribosomal protein L1
MFKFRIINKSISQLGKRFFSPRNVVDIPRFRSNQTDLVSIQQENNQPILTEENKIEKIKHLNLAELDLNSSNMRDGLYSFHENKIVYSRVYDRIEEEHEDTVNALIKFEMLKYLRILNSFKNFKEQQIKLGKRLEDLELNDLPEELKTAIEKEEESMTSNGLSIESRVEEIIPSTLKIATEDFDYFQKYFDYKHNKILLTESVVRQIENIKPVRMIKYNSRSHGKYIYDNPADALDEIRIYSDLEGLKESEKITLEVILNLDLFRSEHNIKESIKLPAGAADIPKICVITTDDNKELCYSAGAYIVMHSENFENLAQTENAEIEFNRLICTKGELETISKYSEFLERHRLSMPDESIGTIVSEGEELINQIQKINSNHLVLFTKTKQDKYNNKIKSTAVELDIANLSMTDSAIYQNINAVMQALSKHQPRSLLGRYFLSANLTLNKKTFFIDIKSLDPHSQGYYKKKNRNKVR